MTNCAIVAVLCAVLLTGPVLAGGLIDEIFIDGFEPGDFCAWSSFGDCADVASILDSLTDVYEVCLAEQTLMVSGLPVGSICQSSQCTGGQSGCPLVVEVNTATFDRVTGDGTVDLGLSPAEIDVHYLTTDCTLSVDSATLSGSFHATLEPVCSTAVDWVTDIDVTALDYTYSLSGCSGLGSVLPLVDSFIDGAIRGDVEGIATDIASGVALCPP